jgi:hypothetical protein
MVKDVTSSVTDVVDRTESGLETLVNKQKVLTETNDEGDEVYTLVSEEQESILGRAQDKAAQISPHQLSAWIESRLRENDEFFKSDGSRHEVDLGDERLVPLRYEYSVLDPVDRAPTPSYDALGVRILADSEDSISEQVETWQSVNDGRGGGEHLLITVEIPETMLERIRNVIGMGQVLDEETESHEELEREHRTDKRRLEASVSEILEDAAVYTVHEHRGGRTTVLEDVIADQLAAVFGSSRRVLSQPLVEVDDATSMASFFRGSEDWPLSETDAAMLGIDTATATIADSGWVPEFIEQYERQKSVDVEALLQQTRTANGDYRGTPQESIAVLCITLATSNESVVLKQDTEYLTEPAAIGRQVRTKGGLMSLQIRFGVKVIDPKAVKKLARVVLDREPAGDGPDEWVAELGTWVDEHSTLVKRTLKHASREFDVSLPAFEAAIEPALAGKELSTADVGGDSDLETILAEAETFADARELFDTNEDGNTLWGRFSEQLNVMSSLYPNGSITASMRATKTSDVVPSTPTVESRLEDAKAHRLQTVEAQYQRITGEPAEGSDPNTICEDLTDWLRTNEDSVRQRVDIVTTTFGDVTFDALEAVFQSAWDGHDVSEADIVDSVVIQDAKTFETVRPLFEEDEGDSLWVQLQRAGERLRRKHPGSPTTETVETMIASARPPTEQRVRRLLEQAADPKPKGTGDETWDELQRVADRLRGELPNATITDEVTAVVDTTDRPPEERAEELLDEARTMLSRKAAVAEALDELDEGDIVLIED